MLYIRLLCANKTSYLLTYLIVVVVLQVDRAPTGSGVTARIAVQYARKHIDIGQQRAFQSAATGSQYTGSVVRPLTCTLSDHPAIIAEVSGTAYYTGTAKFTVEDSDKLKHGFLLK